MLWLQTPPWGRWLAAGLIVTLALWIELRPDPLVDHPFAVISIYPGAIVDETNTELRRVPAGLFDQVELGIAASRDVAAGAPILQADVAEDGSIVPSGWWVVSTDVPASAVLGDRVRLVLLESGTTVQGVVTLASIDDTFGSLTGGVAVPGEVAAKVATAAANGRLAVLLSTG